WQRAAGRAALLWTGRARQLAEDRRRRKKGLGVGGWGLGFRDMKTDRSKETVLSFRDLVVWQKSVDLAERVYAATRIFPKDEVYGLTNQMRRAAVSIASNIAEGHARQT